MSQVGKRVVVPHMRSSSTSACMCPNQIWASSAPGRPARTKLWASRPPGVSPEPNSGRHALRASFPNQTLGDESQPMWAPMGNPPVRG
eukprot:6867735-Prymnesium_polylepis.1